MFSERQEKVIQHTEFVHKELFANGLEVLVYEMPWAQSVTARLLIKAGLHYEDERRLGITHFLEHMLLEGSGRYPSRRELDKAIESMGGRRRNFTFEEYAKYEVKVPVENADFSTEYLKEYVFNPEIRPEAVLKERGIITADLSRSQDIPSQQRHNLLRELLWKGHRLGRNPVGSVESIQRINQQDLTDYHCRLFRPNNAILAIAGNVTTSQALGLAMRDFSDLSASFTEFPVIPPVYSGSPRVMTEKRDIQQTHLLIAFSTQGIGRSSSKIPEVQILTKVVSKSIFHRFVYDLGLSYVAGSYSWLMGDNGSIIIAVEVEPKNTVEAVEQVVHEINQLNIDEGLIQEAKASVMSDVFLDLADSDDYTRFIGEQQLFTNTVKSPSQIKSELQMVTVDDIQELKRNLFTDANTSMVVLGPVSENRMNELDSKLVFE